MSISVADPAATRVRCDDEKLWIELTDGRVLGTPLGFYPRLMHASPEQRTGVELSGAGTGLHWDEFDEDISVAGLLKGGRDNTKLGREHEATCDRCRLSSGIR